MSTDFIIRDDLNKDINHRYGILHIPTPKTPPLV